MHIPLITCGSARRLATVTALLASSITAALHPAGAQATATRSRAPRAAVAVSQWTPDRARAWYDSVGWVVGANFVPSTASNEFEMWQAATWDPTTIDRELGWAQALGMNTMRVYLHDALWTQDSTGFLRRMDQFLTIADTRGIRPIFVLFDAVWDPNPKTGKQREPRPFLHNSTWAQSPGIAILTDYKRHDSLRPYVQGVIRRFGKDRRVLAWDVFNEPDNINRPAYVAYEPVNKGEYSLALMKKAFQWARAAGVTQPLTAAPWKGDFVDTTRMLPITKWMLENSDVITIHSYDSLPRTQELVAAVRRYNRPVIISEYMARPNGSRFETHLPWLASERVGAINWGFVNGRSQTIYPWDSWTREYDAPPTEWFHDIFQTDGRPYKESETTLIRRITAEVKSGRAVTKPGAAGAAAEAAAMTPAATGVAPFIAAPDTSAGVTRQPFGTLPDGKAVELFTVRNARGTEMKVINYGGIITHLRTRDRAGKLDDVVLGYDTLADYLEESPYFGAIVGRVANRIAKGRFTLGDSTYTLARNNGQNTLHGGTRGFDKVVWTAEPFTNATTRGVTLQYVSSDGEEGFPGTLTTTVQYALSDEDELSVEYKANTDRATPVNLSQHSYWNLAGTGAASGAKRPLPTILSHLLTINANAYTPVDSTLIPVGQITPVTGTPFDFRQQTAIGARITQPHQQLKYGGGYDHNWVLDRRGGTGLVQAATLTDPTSGRTLTIRTTEPGLQFYSGNFLDGKIIGKAGRVYPYRSAVALETQHYPDSPNQPSFPSVTLRPGQTYRTHTVFSFGIAR